MSLTFDGFRRYAHARVITDLNNMEDYHEERTLKASKKAKTKTRRTDYKKDRDAGKRQRSAEKRLCIATQNNFVDILFALELTKLLRI